MESPVDRQAGGKSMSRTTACSTSICCPACYGQLSEGQCQRCGEQFSSTFGIVDLRWPRPKAEESDDADQQFELAFLKEVLPAYGESSYRELVEIVMQISRELLDVPEEVVGNFEAYRKKSEARGTLMLEMFSDLASNHFPPQNKRIALDIGCGVGTATVALAQHYRCAIGLDPMLTNLLLAQKYCLEQGIDNTVFVQGFAQQLPINDRCVDFTVALNVIEHLMAVEEAFFEVARVLVPHGSFCGDSRNRYDLFFPEPHIQLRFFGFVPRRFQKRVARKLRNMPYDNIKLLSFLELKRFARNAFGKAIVITYPQAAAYGYPSKWDNRLLAVRKVPILRTLLLALFPTLLLVARSPNS